MKSKLLSAVAVGTSWEKDGTTFYHQNVEFENGDKGQANSKTPKAIWVIGDEYTYEKKANGKYTNITGMKPAEGFSKSGGLSKEDMTLLLAKSSVALLVAQKSITEAQSPAALKRITDIMNSL
jgi:hypothetical protein